MDVSVIFIQENAAFNQVLTYQDWHNELLNTINFILLVNFKESFFNYLKLREKVANFSERSSRHFSSAIGAIESTVMDWRRALVRILYMVNLQQISILAPEEDLEEF